MSSNSRTFSNVNLNDVYDFAYNIAQDFERISLLLDVDILKPVIEKVINVLEILEVCVKKIEHLEGELSCIRSNNLLLYSEKIGSEQEKCKLRKIYEESEELWLEEVVKLKSELSALKSENESLRNLLAERKETSTRSDDKPNEANFDQSDVLSKLKHIIKQKDRQLQDNVSTISALNSRVQELLKMNEILHVKNQEARNDISKLIVEKNEARNEAKLHKKENILLRETLQELLQSNSSIQENDMEASATKSSAYPYEGALATDSSWQQYQESVLAEKVKKLQAELQNLRAKSVQHEASKLSSDKNIVPLSKIHQLFHLFLGVTTISELFWF